MEESAAGRTSASMSMATASGGCSLVRLRTAVRRPRGLCGREDSLEPSSEISSITSEAPSSAVSASSSAAAVSSIRTCCDSVSAATCERERERESVCVRVKLTERCSARVEDQEAEEALCGMPRANRHVSFGAVAQCERLSFQRVKYRERYRDWGREC